MAAPRTKPKKTTRNAPLQDTAPLQNVLRFASHFADSLDHLQKSLDETVYEQFREISNDIMTMRKEIARLQPADLTGRRLPTVNEELEEVLQATEAAAHTIMENAEALLAADPSDPNTYAEAVSAHSMQIIEACAFQDITGQRVAKMADALRHIERRVSKFADAIGTVDEEIEQCKLEAARERRQAELILHGPQKTGEGVSQDDVDKHFQGGESSQADIDSLFD
jgi:chemotaxis protein CheZ